MYYDEAENDSNNCDRNYSSNGSDQRSQRGYFSVGGEDRDDEDRI